jgi:hypothetical protein
MMIMVMIGTETHSENIGFSVQIEVPYHVLQRNELNRSPL